MWQAIRDMQQACRGLVPQRTGNIKDEEGHPCTMSEAKEQRWRWHFTGILNIESHFNLAELDKVRRRPLRSLEELGEAVSKLKNGKSGGSSGVLPEMVKVSCQDSDFQDLLLDLVHTAWREKCVPKDWVDAVIVPIPKKGDLSDCNNWRGISLFDVVCKVTARILQDRLQQLVDEELPVSQCGLRKGRGCTDMIFAVRQLVEKTWEHLTKAFILFIDLRNAYDSVPHRAMWLALAKLGIPSSIIQLIQSFH